MVVFETKAYILPTFFLILERRAYLYIDTTLHKCRVIKIFSDLRQVDGILRVLRFPPSIKLTATI